MKEIANKDMKYIAIAISGKYWVQICKPTDKETAAKFEGAQCRGESFAVVTVDDFNNHQFTLR